MPLTASDETVLLALVPSLEPNVSAPQGWALCVDLKGSVTVFPALASMLTIPHMVWPGYSFTPTLPYG